MQQTDSHKSNIFFLQETQLESSSYQAKLGQFKTYLRKIWYIINVWVICTQGYILLEKFNFFCIVCIFAIFWNRRFFRQLKDNDLQKIFAIVCKKGLGGHLEILLKKGANPNCAPNGVLEAAFYGHHAVLRALKEHRADLRVTRQETKETILHIVLRKEWEKGREEDFEKCLQCLIGDPQVN